MIRRNFVNLSPTSPKHDDTVAVLRFSNAAEAVGQIVLAMSVLDVAIELGPFSHEMIAPPQQIPGGPHSCRIDIGHGNHASPQQNGDFVGIDPVIFGFTAVDGFHVEGMSQDKWNIFLDTEVGDPVPCEHTFRGHDDILPVRFDDLQEGVPIGVDVAVKPDFAGSIEDADVHFLGMQVDSAIKFVGEWCHILNSELQICTEHIYLKINMLN